MSNNSKHTQGKVGINSACKTEVNTDNGIAIAECHMSTMIGQQEKEANALLIADCFNVTNEIGLTPRELLDRVKLLEGTLNEIAASTRGYANATLCRVNRLSMKHLNK